MERKIRSRLVWCLITINLQPRYECHAALCGCAAADLVAGGGGSRRILYLHRKRRLEY